jgi:hypothetical protein
MNIKKIKRNKILNALICISMAAILIFTMAGCATVGEKRTAKLHDRLMAMFVQLDEAKDAAVIAGTATDDYIRAYYDLRQSLVNLSPYLPENGIAMDKDTYKEIFSQLQAAETEVEAFVEK